MDGKQLRNSILQWAIQGKLVPQDPNDEPASVLLERIREEKARLVREKKIKRDKNESIIYRGDDNSYYEKFTNGKVVCIDSELPYNLPSGWSWCRLNELGSYRKGPFGSSLTKSMFVPKSENSIKVYEQKNAIQKDFRLGDYYISEEKFQEMQSFVTGPSDIIVSCAGTIGETYLLPNDAPKGIINQALMRVELYDLEIAEYWQLFFSYVLLIDNKMKGAGSAIKNIPPFDFLKAILVPVPPLREQKKIITKYNELTELINHYDHLNEKYVFLNNSITALIKKSILQQAIQGKIVEQNPDDEPASKLLEKIQAEKERLVKEGKLKKAALNDSIIFKGNDNKYYEKRGKEIVCIDDEIPFEIPSTWAWVRLKSILNVWSARRVHEKDWRNTGIPFYRAREIGRLAEDGAVDNDLFIEKTFYDEFSLSGVPTKGDIMVTAVGTLGKAYVVKDDKPFYFKDGSVLCFGNRYHLNSIYLKHVIESPFFVNQYIGESQGTTVATLTMVRVNEYFVPIPPLAEQERIVNALETTWQVLDRLIVDLIR